MSKPAGKAAEIAAWRQRTRERENAKIAAERARLEELRRAEESESPDRQQPSTIATEGNGRRPSQ